MEPDRTGGAGDGERPPFPWLGLAVVVVLGLAAIAVVRVVIGLVVALVQLAVVAVVVAAVWRYARRARR